MNDMHEQFDLKIREMLQDAELKAPRGAWRTISSRLKAAPVSWLSWASAALVAAAITAGVFIVGNMNRQSAMDVSNTLAVLDQEATLAEEMPLLSDSENKPIEKATIQRIRTVCPEEQTVPEFSSPSDHLPMQDTETENAETATRGQEAEEIKTVQSRPERKTIQLADTYPERPLRKRRIQLYAQGLLGSNDSNSISTDRGLMSAPLVDQLFNGMSETTTSTYGIPVTLGVGVRVHFGEHFAIGTGVDYSLLTRSFSGNYTQDGQAFRTDVHHSMQYIGVPVNLYLTPIRQRSNFSLYLHGGAEAEWCVSNKYHLLADDSYLYKKTNRPQLSAGAGIGVDFRLSKHVGLYLDPGIRYYFPSGQPKNIRTEKPFMATFNAGLRLDI